MRRRLTIKRTVPVDLTLKEWGLVAVVERSGGVGSLAELSRITGSDVRVLRRVLLSLRAKRRVVDLSGGGFLLSYLPQRKS